MPLPPNTAVVLLPPEHAADLIDIAAEWTASWLLTPAVYVDLSAVHGDASADCKDPLVVPCQVVGRNGVQELDLFQALGRYESDLLRLVAVRLVEQPDEAAVAQDQYADAVRDAVQHSGRSTLRLVTVNLIVATTNQDSADPLRLLQPDWTANVIASPEDRESLRGFDSFTRASRPDRFLAFALSHAAAAAGLWAGSTTGPYDAKDVASPSQVTIQRVAVRGVFAEGMLTDVAAAAAHRLAETDLMSDELIVATVSHLEPLASSEVEPAVARLLQDSLALDGEALRYHKPPAAMPVEPRRVGLGKQFREFVTFAGDALRSIPGSVAEGMVRRVSHQVTSALHGPSGQAEVVVESWMPTLSRDLKTASERLEAEHSAARSELDSPLPHARDDLHPGLWESLRQLSFASLDGSQMPPGIRPLGHTAPGVEVLSNVGILVPDWQDTWAPSMSGVTAADQRFDLTGKDARWYDDASVSRWRTRLAAATGKAKDRAKTTDEATQRLRTKLDVLDQEQTRLTEVAKQVSDEAENLRADLADLIDYPAPPRIIDTPGASRPPSPPAPGGMSQEPGETPSPSAATSPNPHQAQGATLETRAADPLRKKRGGWLKTWFRRRQPTALLPEPAPAQQQSTDVLATQLKQTEARLRESNQARDVVTRRFERMGQRTAEATGASAAAASDLGDITAVEKNFVGWLGAKQRSWAILLLNSLSSERGGLQSDWDQLRASLEILHPTRPEVLRRMHARFVRRVLWSGVIALFATIAIPAWVVTERGEEWFLPWLYAALRVGAPCSIVAAIGFAVAVLASLVSYHRAISQGGMLLRRHLDKVRRAAAAVSQIRSERVRINSLHEQVPEFLMLLSEVCQRPWVVSLQAQELDRVPRPDVARLPAHVRLAEPLIAISDGDGAARIREAVCLGLHRGWRSDAFSRLLRVAEQGLSLQHGSLDVHVIDSDARQRKVLLDSLVAGTGGAGTPGLHVQERLGAQMVRDISRAYDTSLIDDDEDGGAYSFPQVREITLDALDNIDLRIDVLADPNAVAVTDWNAYLAELLTVQPELSWYGLAGEVKSWIHGGLFDDELRAYITGPARLSSVAMAEDSGMHFQPLSSSHSLPAELVVRLDQRTLPSPFDVVLFHGDRGQQPRLGDADPVASKVDSRDRNGEVTPPFVNY